jgi:hypothetical protein
VRAARRDVAVADDNDLATNTVNIPIPPPTPAVLQRAGAMLVQSLYATGAGTERHRAAGADCGLQRAQDRERVELRNEQQIARHGASPARMLRRHSSAVGHRRSDGFDRPAYCVTLDAWRRRKPCRSP